MFNKREVNSMTEGMDRKNVYVRRYNTHREHMIICDPSKNLPLKRGNAYSVRVLVTPV